MTKSFVCAIGAAAFAFAAFASAPAMAKTAKACEAEYQAGKADIQKSGKKKTDFMTECRAQPEAKADTNKDKAADTKAEKKAKADQARAEAKAKADQEKTANKAAADKEKADKKAAADKAAADKKAAADTKKAAATPAKPAEKPVAANPTANEPDGKPGRVAFVARERACGADWKADKAAGKTGDQKWPQYWSDCNKRKKAAGM